MDTKLTLFFETLREFFNFPTVGSKVGEETEEEQGVQVAAAVAYETFARVLGFGHEGAAGDANFQDAADELLEVHRAHLPQWLHHD